MADAAKGYLIGEGFRHKLQRTIAAVEGTPVGGGGFLLRTDLSGDSPAPSQGVRLAAFPAEQGWRKGDVAAISMYTHDGVQFGPTGETATAINISVDYAPLSVDSQGTAAGPTPTMTWCVVGKSRGAYVALEAEPDPIARFASRSTDKSEWSVAQSKAAVLGGSGKVVDVTNPFDHYTTLDAPNGLVVIRGATSAGGVTSHMIIGPPPTPMHAAFSGESATWERGQIKTLTALPDGVRTTPGQVITVSNPFFDGLSIESGVPLPVGKFGTSFHVISAPASSVKFGDYTPTDKDSPWDRTSQRPVRIWGSTNEVTVVNQFEHYTNLDIHNGLAFAKSPVDPNGGDNPAYVAIGPPSIPMHVATSKTPGQWSKGAARTLVAEASSLLPSPQPVDVTNKFFDDLDVPPGDQVAIGKFGSEYFVISQPSAGALKFGDYTPPDKSSPWDRTSQRPVRPWGSDEDVIVVNQFEHYTNLDLHNGLVFAKSKVNPSGGDGTAYIAIGPPSVPLHIATSKDGGQWTRGQVRELVAEADALRQNPQVVDVTNRFFDAVDVDPGKPVAIGKFGGEYCVLTGAAEGVKFGDYTPPDKDSPWDRTSQRPVKIWGGEEEVIVVNPFEHYTNLDLSSGVVIAKSPINPNGGDGPSYVAIGPPSVPLHAAMPQEAGNWPRGETRTLTALPNALRPFAAEVSVVNKFFDDASCEKYKQVAIGKIGSEYCLMSGGDTTLKKVLPGVPRVRKGFSGQFFDGQDAVQVVSIFEGYESSDLRDGVVIAKVRDGVSGQSQQAIISPPPIPLYLVDYKSGPTWTKGSPQPVTLLYSRTRYPGESSFPLLTSDGQGVRNEVVGDIEPGDTPLVVGKFGDQLHVIAAETQPGVKLATRTDNFTWEKGSLRDVTLFGTQQTVQAYNAAGNYESFDGRSSGGLPGLALAKGKAPGGQGTAYYVISPAPITFATGTFSGLWQKGQSKQINVNVGGQSGSVTVVNQFSNVGSTASASRACAMSKQGSQWYLVAAEC